MTPRFLVPAACLAAMIASHAAAQEGPTPAATTPLPVATAPAADAAVPPPVTVTLPAVAPAAAPIATPTPTAAATPRATATATPRAIVAATPTPVAPAAIASAPTPIPTASPPVADTAPDAVVAGRPAAALPRTEESGPLWMLPVSGGLIVGLLLMAFLIRRRRRRALLGEGEDMPEIEAPSYAEPPVAVVPADPDPGANLSFDLRPRRAGVNLLTATLEAEIVVRNHGDAPADRVRVDLSLLSARGQQEDELAATFADERLRPAVPPFALAPGEARTVTTLATLARQDINAVTAGDRPMFVPVAAVSVRYIDGERTAQVAQAFALGVEREGVEKLGPFWLDAPSRMHDAVGARPYAAEVRR